ncbi:hypothetical protein KSS87_018620 [Heliosperma pusillum]|nr:hypothetical protein KSS87_018620 [Heliosperma pusillum]
MAIAPILTISQLNVVVRLTYMNVRVVHKWERHEFKEKTKNEAKEKSKTEAIELLLLDAEAGYYYTFAKLINLVCTAYWYYDSYKLCRTKCSKNDRVRWKCDRYLCDDKLSGFTSRVPRFQVKFVVTDASNEEANFMVFDTQIIQFITHTAAELPAKIEKVDIHGKYNVSQGSNLYTVSSMSDDEDLANKWIAKYTETFKEDYNFFKSSTKALMVRIQNAKVNKDGSIENIEGHNKLQAKGVHHEEEKSETAETSPKITPHKRSSPSIIAQRKELIEFSCETGDACSTTKKHVIEKKEK